MRRSRETSRDRKIRRAQRSRDGLRLTAWIFGTFSLLAFAVGIGGLIREARFGARALPAQGVVIGRVIMQNNAILHFRTARGEEVEFTSSAQFSEGIGETKPILYDPAHPQTACINGFLYRWFWPCLCLVFGLAFAVPAWFTAGLSTLEGDALRRREDAPT